MLEKIKANHVLAYIKKHWFIFLAVLVYGLSTFYYMGPSFTNCQTVTYGFGDNTAGPIWRSMLPEEQGLLGTKTETTNVPYGDTLYSPIGFSLILQTVLIKGMQAVAGPVCGYNLINIIGFMSGALLMFGLIFALTRNRWIALLSGYTVSFSPYYQMKVGGHPSYGYQALFIAIIWLFYRLMKYRRKRDALYLAISYAVFCLKKKNFTLYATVVVGSLGLAWLFVYRSVLINVIRRSKSKVPTEFKYQFRRLLLAAASVIVLLLPLIAAFISQSQQINSDVAAARGNVLAEAKACSNYPLEYVTPFILSPFFEGLLGDENFHNFVEGVRGGLTCGIGEDTVGLSILLVLLVLAAMLIYGWERLNGRRLGLHKTINSYNPQLVIASIIIIGAMGLIISMPPVKFHGIATPTYELLQLTETWRTLTRGYMLVNISLVAFSSLVLAYIARNYKRHKGILVFLFILLMLGIIVEYQAFKPFTGNKLSTFNYQQDIPAIYAWLKEQKDIDVIAEYPLEIEGRESDAGSYYLTMQSLHKKRLFNSALSTSPQEKLRSGLKNLHDPQTLSSLRAFGVDAIVVHGVSKEDFNQTNGSRVVQVSDQPRFNITSHTQTVKNDRSIIISIKDVKPSSNLIMMGEGVVRNVPIIISAVNWKYEAINGAELHVARILKNKLEYDDKEKEVCFQVQSSLPNDRTSLMVSIDGKPKENLGVIIDMPTSIVVKAKSSIKIYSANGHNMRLSGLGCE